MNRLCQKAETAIGTVYLVLGIFGMFENGITTFLMATDKEMRNPTYLYMINLSICDVIILIPIGVYAGLVTLWPRLLDQVPLRLCAYLTGIGWYPGCLFMVFASFSRYVQLGTHKINIYFTRKNLILTISLGWLIPSILYTWCIYYQPIPFTFFPRHYTWNFNRLDAFGNGLAIFNITVNSLFAILINICNIKSFICVREIRKQTEILQNNANQKREIKLFAQCAITGTIYTMTVIYFFAVSAVEDKLEPFEFLITHVLWIINHCQNPVIYFTLNGQLRQKFFALFRCQKAGQVGPGNTTGIHESRVHSTGQR